MKNDLLTPWTMQDLRAIVEIREELRAGAVYIGQVTHSGNHDRFTGKLGESWRFHDCEHYFNADMQETAMANFIGSRCESVIRFNPPRVWGEPAKQTLHLLKGATCQADSDSRLTSE